MDTAKPTLFFACEVAAPWPTVYPKGRLVESSARHMTLAFLGHTPLSELQQLLPQFPEFPSQIGPSGVFDFCLFLPENDPHVVAWHAQYFDPNGLLSSFQTELVRWLRSCGYRVDARPFLPHVTIARSPFERHQWKVAFNPLPFIIKAIHLYESKGNLIYEPVWTYPLLPAFEELEHTADIAFIIRAESVAELHYHAQIALAFKYPPLVNYIHNISLQQSLDDVVVALNHLVAIVDGDIGCPIKAISYHGRIEEEQKRLKWEMIVDV